MEIEEFKKITKSILEGVNAENIDTGNISDLLTQLNTDYEKTQTSLTEITKSNEDLTKNNESLRKVNMQLFTQVGQTKPQDGDNTDTSKNDGDDGDGEDSKVSIDSLFDDRGNFI